MHLIIIPSRATTALCHLTAKFIDGSDTGPKKREKSKTNPIVVTIRYRIIARDVYTHFKPAGVFSV